MTNVFTGVSGITSLSPALSVAQKAPRAVFAVYSDGGYAIQAIDDIRALEGGPIVQLPPTAAALPPLERAEVGTGIATLIRDPKPVPPAATVDLSSAVKDYRPKLSLDFIAQPSLAVAADRFGTYIGGGATLYWSDMLGDHNLVTMAQFQGRLSDFAAATAYLNRKSRLTWAVGAQQIPYIYGGVFGYQDPNTGLFVEEIQRIKQTNRGLDGVAAYPFNRSDRFEVSAGLQQISYDNELQKHGFNQDGSPAFDSTIHFPVPPPVTLEQASFALVHDNSYYGATGPILGDRWRLEADPTFGGLQFLTTYVDYRKYVMPLRPFTLAVRALHIGRYGRDAEDQRIYPLFIGYQSLVRGYDRGSFQTSECTGGSATSCPVFDQLWGSRLLVGNIELRFPPFGLLGAGGGYYGILPIEAGIFYDAGVAWTQSEGARLFGGTRNWVRSAGVSLRMNLLGYAIGQMDIVHPFDRPQKNWMVRFGLTEGF